LILAQGSYSGTPLQKEREDSERQRQCVKLPSAVRNLENGEG